MQTQPALDQRRHPRRDAGLLVGYRPKDQTVRYDISEARNVSQGGMLLTTARAFAPGAQLALWVKLPSRGLPRLMLATVEAVGSREVVPSLIYETRVRFVDLDRLSVQIIGDFCAEMGDALSPT